MHTHSVYLISSARTAIGSFQGALHTVAAPRLGAAVIAEAIHRAKLEADDVDEVFMGCVLTGARGGYRMGNAPLAGTMIHDGLWDPHDGCHMGMAAELCAREHGFTRQRQDNYAVESYRRALSAQKEGLFRSEILPMSVEESGGSRRVFDEDEEPRKFVEERLRRLKPAFDPAGTVTAGNASSISDGAAAVVIASARAVHRLGFEPMARIVTWSGAAHEPRWWTTAPVPAMKRALDQAQLHLSDIDFWEINEAFAVVAFSVTKEYLTQEPFKGLPVVPLEDVQTRYPPDEYEFFIPMTGRSMNRLRESIYRQVKAKGYRLITYVNSKATIFSGASIGENCFILEDNTIQPFASIGTNVVLWSVYTGIPAQKKAVPSTEANV